jgi:FixJ family two-component response regulator
VPGGKASGLIDGLGSDEHRMLDLIVDGYSLIKIAGDLGLPLEETVRTKANLMKKLGATTTADLVRIGLYAQAEEGH